MQKYLKLLLLLPFVILLSCNKNNPVDGYSLLNSYMPMATNYVWHYADTSAMGSGTFDYTITKDTTIKGVKYYVLFSGFLMSNFYFREDNAYKLYNMMLSADTAKEIKFFDASVAPGTTWSYSLYVKGVENKYTYTYIKHLDNITVKGKVYTDINVMEEKLEVKNGSGYTTSLDNIYNYSKGVGLVLLQVQTYGMTVSLTSYTF